MIQIAKNKLFGHFLDFGQSDRLEIAYYNRYKQCAGLANSNTHHSKIIKKSKSFLDDLNSKKIRLGHFLEFCASDWLEIAYFNRNEWFASFGLRITHARSFKNHKNAFLNDPNSQK